MDPEKKKKEIWIQSSKKYEYGYNLWKIQIRIQSLEEKNAGPISWKKIIRIQHHDKKSDSNQGSLKSTDPARSGLGSSALS